MPVGIDEYTKLMLHFDGTDGSTTFTDSSISPKTVTRYGDSQIDTAQYKFNSSSGLFDGNGDYLTVNDSDDWYFGDGDFTIDMWIRLNETLTSGYRFLVSHAETDTKKFIFYLRNGTLAFVAYNSSNTVISQVYGSSGTPFNDLGWHHIALVKYGTSANSIKLYIDGASIDLTVVADILTGTIVNASSPLCIAKQNVTGSEYYYNGWIDELRISKGIARWTSNFTTSNEEYYRGIPSAYDSGRRNRLNIKGVSTYNQLA